MPPSKYKPSLRKYKLNWMQLIEYEPQRGRRGHAYALPSAWACRALHNNVSRYSSLSSRCAPGGGGGVGTRPRYLIVCLWQRLLASRHRSF